MEKKPYILTEEEKNDIMQTLEESASQNKNLKVLSELPSNNGQENHTPEQGEPVQAIVKIDPKTGEHTVVGPASDIVKEDEDVMDNLSDLAERDLVTEFDINPEDIKKISEEETSIIGKFEISDETCIELIKIINQKRLDKKKITYNMLPEQVKGFVDNYLKQSGIVTYSVENNTIRNNISEMLIDDFISNIGMNKCIDDFNSGIEKIYEEAGKEISPLIKDYNNSRTEYLEKLLESVEDDSKRDIIEKTLDAINDAYNLTRLKESASRIKVKKFDLEKPKRTFDSFLSKYKDSKYNIYDLSTVLTTLNRHLVWNKLIEKDDITSALSFLIALCKFCTNYKPEVPDQHAFMFYITYNIVLLDIYKDDQYEEFAKPLLNNIKDVIDNLK